MKTRPGSRYDEATHQWLPADEPAKAAPAKPTQKPEPVPAPTAKD